MADLEYPDVFHEVKGALAQGRLKLSEQNIIFKNSKTGKVDNLNASDIDLINWQKLVSTSCLRIFLKNGTLHRYHGFKETEHDKISKFVSSNYNKELADKEMSVKGWNWGTAKFSGALLSFDIGSHTAFEIPLNYVSQCTTGKNEVTIEYHNNDDAPVNLMEMRFFIPSSELAGDDPVDAFHQNVMNKASVISMSGDALAIFREIPCLNPRGRYDIKLYTSFFQLHGKTFDYKIPTNTVLRLFLLPHIDRRQIFFVVSMDPPIKQGQTRYHFLVFLFPLEDDEVFIELPFTDEELKEKFGGKLTKELKGQTYEVVGRLMKEIIGRKLTTSNFVGKSETPAVACSYKAANGYIYPLERGFIYLRKPPFYIRFEEIISVNFARSEVRGRSFDFEVEVKSGIVHTFSNIEKDEYAKLFDFVTAKKLVVKNRGKSMDKASYREDDLVDSDQEEPDAYLARVKREAKERDDDDGGSNDGSSTDEDFNPGQEESDVAEEYDSNAPTTESEEGGSDDASGKPEKKEKHHKKAKTVSEKPRKKRETKKKQKKDANAPKRPQSAYFLWMNENREKMKEKYPNLSVAEVAKKSGELWKEVKDKSEWEEKAKKAKADYEEAMREYKANKPDSDNEDDDDGKPSKKSKSKAKPKSSPSKAMSGTGFKSKEYLSDTGSSDSGSDKKTSKDAKSKPKAKSKKDSSASEAHSSEDEKAKSKSKPKPKSKKESSASDASDSGNEKASSKKRKKEDSDKETSKKKAKSKTEEKKGKSKDVVDEDDDEFPEEPDESTPPTTEGSGSDSGSD